MHLRRPRLAIAAGIMLVTVAGGPVIPMGTAAAASGPTFVREAAFNGGAPVGYFGENVAMSADGKVVLVGAPDANGLKGEAWLYKRGSQSWSSVRLTGPRSTLGFGMSVAVSADGRFGLIGAPRTGGGTLSNAGSGAVFAYNLSGAGGLYVGTRLPVTGVKGKAGFGSSVSLSADGRIAVVGGLHDDGDRGAAWVFQRTGSTWQQLRKLAAPAGTGKARFGTSVAVSAAGRTFIVGAPYEGGGKGAVWLFYVTGTTVTTYPPRRVAHALHPLDETGNGRFGQSVAISADGTRFIVGAPFDNGSRGAIWMFESTSGVYMQSGLKMRPSGARGSPLFGSAVALSADGSSAMIGGSADDANKGAVWLFATGVAYPMGQVGPKMAGATGSRFGSSIALSPEGNRVLIGGPQASARKGAAWLFVDKPVVEGVNPRYGPSSLPSCSPVSLRPCDAGGTAVKIVGSGFAGVRSVTFGDTPATSFTVDSRTQITAVAPEHPPGKVAVKVTTNLGTSGVRLAGYTFLKAPFVSQVAPASGPPSGGTQVTITGLDFIGVTRVAFGDREAAFKVNSATEIVAEAPPGSGTVPVSITTPGGVSAMSDAARFTYANAPVTPSIGSISPASGPVAGGTEVTITGTDLGGASAVMFGATAATSFTVDSTTQIRAVSPPGQIGTVDITVTTPGGTSATVLADRFTYRGLPTVSAISPTLGPTTGGTQVTITGTNLAGATAVRFGATAAASFTVDSATQIRAVSPPRPFGIASITVTTPGGTSVAGGAAGFAYFSP